MTLIIINMLIDVKNKAEEKKNRLSTSQHSFH